MKLKIRISRSYADLKEFATKLAEVCDVLVVYEHEADDEINRTHIHCYASNPQVSTDTMKNWVKKALGTKVFPKTDWSFPEAEDEGFITYMSKGHLSPLLIKGIESDAVAALKDKWVDMPKRTGKTQYVLKIENPQQQKMRQAEMVAEIRRRIRSDAPPDDCGIYDIAHILTIIIDVVVKQNNTVCGRYKIRDYYDTVMALEHSHKNFSQLQNFLDYRS